MALNRVSTKMIENPVNNGKSIHRYLKDRKVVSVSEFGFNPEEAFSNSTLTELKLAIDLAIEFVKGRGYGIIEIPPVSSISEYTSFIETKKVGSVVNLSYVHSNYRQPVSGRPFGGNYEIGDIVYNSDITRNKVFGWICVKSGSPGTWTPFGFAHDWSSQIEDLESLPEASSYQLGRVVNLTQNNLVYVCKKVGTTYTWACIDRPYGATSSRPTTNLTLGLTYFNTDNQALEVWNGTSWTNSLGNLQNLPTTDKSVVGAITEINNKFSNYYKKTEIYSKTEVDGKLVAITNAEIDTIIANALK